jgi:dolichol-phosphate mannosyltransferase
MLKKALTGYDVVYGRRRRRRGESLFKRVTAALFYRLMRLITQTEIPVDAGDFRLLARCVVVTLRALKERHRFVRGLVAWVGFRQTFVEYDRDARFAGTTKYPLRRMIRFAVDGATSFSTVPLRLATWLGLLTGAIAVLGGLTSTAFRLFIPEIVLPGWTALMVAIAFGFSVQLLITGILGEYVGRIYEEVKRRPLYITEEEINLEPPEPAPRSVAQGLLPESPRGERGS